MDQRGTLITSDDTVSSTTVTRKRRVIQLECKVCGAAAYSSYVGVLTCAPCKMFFKRNAEIKQKPLKCDFGGNCEINIFNRHNCSYCRLKKCFASGMQTELFRPSRPIQKRTNRKKKEIVAPTTEKSNALVMLTSRNQPQLLPTLTLLRSDTSTLSIDQWGLLSNLIHCYDEHGGFLVAERFTSEQNGLPLKARYKYGSLNALYSSLMTGSQLLFEKNADFIALSSHDRSHLIYGRLKYLGGIGACFILSHVKLFDNPAFYSASEAVYGSPAMEAGKATCNLIDSDVVFVKLGLSILAFSTFDYTFYTNTETSNLENITAVLRIQDMYIELAWRYLVYKYGHSRAVISFSNLIRCIFSGNKSTVEAIERKQYTDMVDAMIKQAKQTLSLND
ncbi:unnamed protein product [Rotaria magnacalcarata]|uniref:Nuclear receptor domain-containing protein n=3 Tax=Rotaria magnacalcarata TaxID=392030 RepID=A0A816B6X9_9BILA|nr:unnamed protein product [Rotaria magnacalcarata]CAF2137951.1 unnamed protein product [Rotaria magnacalcarata]